MAVPFGGHPTIGDLVDWASKNGCKVALTVRQHSVTGQPYESLEISNPKGGRVAIAIPGGGERMEPSMVGYVQRRLGLAPHQQTNPNNTQMDNYGTRGNVNPYTGQTGTRAPRY